MQGYIIADAQGRPVSLTLYPVKERADEDLAAWRTEFPGDYGAHRVLPARIVAEPPERWCNLETHDICFYPQNGGSFEDCAAEFDVEYEAGDRHAGEGRWIARAEFYRARIGALTLTRAMLVAMTGAADVEAIEAGVAEDCAAAGPGYEEAAE